MRGIGRRSRESQEQLEARVRGDLERRGLAEATARHAAARIAPQAGELAGDAYATFLDGVAAVQSGDPEGRRGEAGAGEIQRLVQDFAIELKKLDEGLRLLSTYLLRIRDRATKGETPRTRVIH